LLERIAKPQRQFINIDPRILITTFGGFSSRCCNITILVFQFIQIKEFLNPC